ncbi:MAG: putative toxin-antitoxin system toxin component, PIN family, partial [Desulfamplus sp.]|nr:putative toxin-antitoxin system toxin component, PIN family [Desulfamplus sp.]
MVQKVNSIKVVIDTNIWISFLIGKNLSGLSKALIDDRIKILFSDELFEELVEISQTSDGNAENLPDNKINNEKISNLGACNKKSINKCGHYWEKGCKNFGKSVNIG